MMKTRGYILLLILCFASGLNGQGGEPERLIFDPAVSRYIGVYPLKYRFGDDPRWAASHFADSLWSAGIVLRPYKDEPPIYWNRAHIRITDHPDTLDRLCLFFSGISSAADIFWDGELIHSNGRVAMKKEDEIPGNVTIEIPLERKRTSPGDHVLALRLSSHSSRYLAFIRLRFGEERFIGQMNARESEIRYASMGIDLFCVLLSLALFFMGGRHRSHLLFGLSRLVIFFNTLIQVLFNSNGFSMAHYDPLVLCFVITLPLSVVLLNLFYLTNFKIPGGWIHIAGNLILGFAVYFFLGRQYSPIIGLYGLAALVYALIKKRPGAGVSLTGYAVYTLSYYLFLVAYVRSLFWVGDIILVFTIILTVSRQVRLQKREHDRSLLRSSRLETQLLKRNIQPHFLMNTLLSIMSWIGKDPSRAMKMIQALGDEFRLVNEISELKAIPLAKEIDLCHTHLEVMRHRMDAEYELIVQGVDGGESVPPMLFHTLVENGLSHAFDTGENGTFRLTCSKTPKGVHYLFQNDGSLLGQTPQDRQEEGMGLRYIRARLDESYPGRWRLSYGLREGQWEVCIDIDRESRS